MGQDIFLEKLTNILTTDTDINMETPLAEIIEWDSVSFVLFLGMADVSYHKKLKMNDVKKAQTIADLFKLVTI